MNQTDEMNQPEEQDRFEIRDMAGLNWYARKIRNLENEKVTIQTQAKEMLRDLDRDITRLEFMYGQQVQTYVRAELDRRGGHGKTLKLWQGTAVFRTLPASLRVRSAQAAIEHARAQGWDAIKTTETLDVDRYKKEAAAARQETGELLPGMELTEERESFTIRFGKAAEGSEGENEQ